METLHVRFIPLEDCGLHVREAGEDQAESRRVDGRPIIFGVRSRNLTPWSDDRVVYEVLEAGCISPDLIQRSDILLNINHSTKVTDILGRRRNGQGTLELNLRESYVAASCDLPRTNCANDTLELIKRGDISGMSFAFRDDWQDTENGVSYERTNETIDGKVVWIRHVKRITELHDVSIVTNPAYEQTSVVTREAGDDILKTIDELTRAAETDAEVLRESEQAEKEAQEREAAEAAAKEAEDMKQREMDAQRRRSCRRHMTNQNFNY
jgi:HK97 family phage prohead protease